MEKNIYITAIVICSMILIALLINTFRLRSDYLLAMATQEAHEEISGIKYKIINIGSSHAILLIGDLLGTNPLSSKFLENHFSSKEQNTFLIIPRLKENQLSPIDPNEFFEIIATKDGVVLTDNFCINQWSKVKEKELYANTSLFPGPYCFSEPQTRLIDKLIKEYKVSEVLIYYDVPQYIDFIGTFLNYLKESHIPYRLIKTPETYEKT